jgi:hypothetical protein
MRLPVIEQYNRHTFRKERLDYKGLLARCLSAFAQKAPEVTGRELACGLCESGDSNGQVDPARVLNPTIVDKAQRIGIGSRRNRILPEVPGLNIQLFPNDGFVLKRSRG